MRSRLLDLRDFLAHVVGRIRLAVCTVRRWSSHRGASTAYVRFPSTRRTWWPCAVDPSAAPAVLNWPLSSSRSDSNRHMVAASRPRQG